MSEFIRQNGRWMFGWPLSRFVCGRDRLIREQISNFPLLFGRIESRAQTADGQSFICNLEIENKNSISGMLMRQYITGEIVLWMNIFNDPFNFMHCTIRVIAKKCELFGRRATTGMCASMKVSIGFGVMTIESFWFVIVEHLTKL